MSSRFAPVMSRWMPTLNVVLLFGLLIAVGSPASVGRAAPSDPEPPEVESPVRIDGQKPSRRDRPFGASALPDAGLFASQTAVGGTTSPTDVTAAPVRGTSIDVVSAAFSGEVALYSNDGSGSFTKGSIATGFGEATSVDVADIDGDGSADIVASDQLGDEIAWWNNDGTTTFGSKSTVSTGTNVDGPTSVDATDLDDDGDIDVLSANATTGEIVWHENDGSQNFIDAVISSAQGNPRAVHATDLDADGDVDVVAAFANSAKIAWFENDGSQSFTERTISTSVDYPSDVYVTDVNGDGTLDVVGIQNNGGEVNWYDGSNSFSQNNITTNVDLGQAIYATDLDSDGDVDVMSASENDDRIAWYENDGAGNFTQRTLVASASGADQASGVYAGDFDGDGNPDIVGSSRGNDDVFWFENTYNSPPTISTNAGLTLDEGTSSGITQSLLETTDQESDPSDLVYTVDTAPSNGTISVGGTAVSVGDAFTQADINGGSVEYTHDGSETTSDSFDFTVTDEGGTGKSDSGTFSISVNAVNDAPTIATNSTLSLDEGTNADITQSLLETTDPESGPSNLEYTVDTAPSNGTIYNTNAGSAVSIFTQADLNNNRIEYRHDGSETTSDSFDFTVTDEGGSGTSDSGTFSLTINPVNDAPTANGDSHSTDEDQTLSVSASNGVLDNDTDPEGDNLSASVVGGPSNGSLSLNSDGSFSYTPNADYNGSDSFTYEASDGNGGTDQATVSLTINAVNDAPTIATNSTLSLDEGTNADITQSLLETTDPESGPSNLEYIVDTAPSNGTIYNTNAGSAVSTFTQADLNNDRIEYRHDGSETTSDSFDFTVTDQGGSGKSTSGTFSISVNAVDESPTASGDSYTTDEDQTLTVSAANGVLDNDSDPDGDGLTASVVTGPSNGSLTLNSDGSFTYDPNTNYNGSDSFEYEASDGDGGTVQATVDLTIDSVNDAPTLANNAGLTVTEGSASTITQSLLETTDEESDPSDLQYTVDTAPANGTLDNGGTALSAGDTFTQADIDNGEITYTHDGSETTSDSVDFTVTDQGGGGKSVSGTFSLSISETNNAPTIATNSGLTLDEGTASTIPRSLLETTDPESGPSGLVYTVDTAPLNGTLDNGGTALSSGDTFTQADINNGEITYTHDGSATTSDSLDFTVTDQGGGGKSTSGTFSISITPVNDAPTLANNAGLTVTEGSASTITQSLLETTDEESDPSDLQYTIDTAPANGTLDNVGTVLSAGDTFTQADINNGEITYTHDGLATTSDSLNFTVTDQSGSGTSTTGTFSISINATNSAPTISTNAGLTVSEGESSPITRSLLETADSESAPSNLQYTIDTAPVNGTLDNGGTALSSGDTFTQADINNGEITYTHDGSATTSDSFDFTVTDQGGSGTSTSGTFSVTIEPVNTLPATQADTASVRRGDTVSVAVLSNDTDAEGPLDTTSVVVEQAPLHGTVSDVSDGRIAYTPDSSYIGSDSLAYSVVDTAGARSESTPVVLNVQDAALAASIASNQLGGAQVGQSVDTADVRVENVGGMSLTDLQAEVTGGAASDFSVVNVGDGPLASGGSRTIRVLFAPTETGRREAGLTIRSAEGAEAQVALAGRGVSIALSPGEAARGQVGVDVDGSVEGGFVPSERAALYIREGGATRYRTVDSFRVVESRETTAQLRGRVPDTLTTRGLDYYAVLSDGQDTLTVPAGGPARAAAQPRHVSVRFEQWRAPIGLPPRTYRMVSVPARPDDGIKAALENSYGPYDTAKWRALRWDPSTEAYREYDELRSLEPGHAFWLIADNGTAFSLNQGRTVDASSPQPIPLDPGWNQVGSPFDFGVSWERILDASDLDGAALDGPVAFHGKSYRRGAPALQPWRGYLVFNATGEPDTLRVPPVAAGEEQRQENRTPTALATTRDSTSNSKNTSSTPYTLQLTAQTTGTPPQQVWLGLRSGAKRGRDALDFAQAPPIDTPVRLSMQETVAGRSVPHAGSFKPPSDAGQTWTLTLSHSKTASSATTVRLQLDAKGSLPADQRRYVLDLDTERRVTPGQAIELAPGEHRRLKVIVGTEAYAKQQNADVPLTSYETALRDNYPNPFEQETTLEYTLNSGREVTVEVYDVLGRRVRTLVNRKQQERGLHRVRWTGTNQHGEPVAGGVYFYRVEAADFRETRKMVLVR